MAKVCLVNQNPATGAIAMYLMKQLLKSAGWVVKESSDGTTYNAAADIITSGAAGAGGMANNSAWFRIQDPGTRREFCFQRGTTNLVWRVTYSALDKFVTGSPSATRVPTAADFGTALVGGGTDASPSFATLFDTDNTYKWMVVADSAAEGNVYGFWAWAVKSPTALASEGARTTIMLDPLLTGTFSSLDADPCVPLAGNSVAWDRTTAVPIRAWYKMNLTGEAFQTGSTLTFATVTTPGAPNVYDGNDESVRICYTVNNVWKGASKWLRWQFGARVYPSSFNLSSGSYVPAGYACFPWEDGTTPVA